MVVFKNSQSLVNFFLVVVRDVLFEENNTRVVQNDVKIFPMYCLERKIPTTILFLNILEGLSQDTLAY